MSGSLLLQARKDAHSIITSGGFEEDIVLTNTSGFLVNIKGLHTKHWISYDTDGVPMNSKSAHICINEQELNALGYVTRDARTGNVNMQNHKVEVKDATGIVKTYIINETFPSETFGLIVCILGDLKI
jgi:hypothetical protein